MTVRDGTRVRVSTSRGWERERSQQQARRHEDRERRTSVAVDKQDEGDVTREGKREPSLKEARRPRDAGSDSLRGPVVVVVGKGRQGEQNPKDAHTPGDAPVDSPRGPVAVVVGKGQNSHVPGDTRVIDALR